MTPKTLIRTNLTEITALEITCKNCKSVSSVAIPRDNIAEQFQCIGCNTTLWNRGDKITNALIGLMRTLSAWKGLSESAPFEMGFSIETVASRASDSNV